MPRTAEERSALEADIAALAHALAEVDRMCRARGLLPASQAAAEEREPDQEPGDVDMHAASGAGLDMLPTSAEGSLAAIDAVMRARGYRWDHVMSHQDIYCACLRQVG